MGPAHRIQPFPFLTAATALAVLLVGATSVLAQTPPPQSASPSTGAVGVGVVAPEPPRPAPEFGFEPSMPPEQRGSREEEFYPERTRSIHQPAFVKGTSTTVRTSSTSGIRMGLSGWTAPRIPFDFRESSGGAALGLTIEWGTPMPPPPPVEPATPAQR